MRGVHCLRCWLDRVIAVTIIGAMVISSTAILAMVIAVIVLNADAIVAVAQTMPPAMHRQRAADGAVELTVRLDRQRVLVAEPFTLTLSVDAPAGSTITLPSVDQSLGPLSVVDVDTVNGVPLGDEVPLGDRRRWILTIELESLDAGSITVQPLEVFYQVPESERAAGGKGKLLSDEMTIHVVSVLSENESPTEFRGIKGIADPPVATPSIARKAYWSAAIVLLLSALAITWVKSQSGSKESPRRWALHELESLRSMYDNGSLDGGQVCIRLADVMRQFMESQWRFPAVTQSSQEIRKELTKGNQVSESTRQRVDQLLTRADRLKFSGASVSGPDLPEADFETVHMLVKETGEFRSAPGADAS